MGEESAISVSAAPLAPARKITEQPPSAAWVTVRENTLAPPSCARLHHAATAASRQDRFSPPPLLDHLITRSPDHPIKSPPPHTAACCSLTQAEHATAAVSRRVKAAPQQPQGPRLMPSPPPPHAAAAGSRLGSPPPPRPPHAAAECRAPLRGATGRLMPPQPPHPAPSRPPCGPCRRRARERDAAARCRRGDALHPLQMPCCGPLERPQLPPLSPRLVLPARRLASGRLAPRTLQDAAHRQAASGFRGTLPQQQPGALPRSAMG